jgi:hypothetical protein
MPDSVLKLFLVNGLKAYIYRLETNLNNATGYRICRELKHI